MWKYQKAKIKIKINQTLSKRMKTKVQRKDRSSKNRRFAVILTALRGNSTRTLAITDVHVINSFGCRWLRYQQYKYLSLNAYKGIYKESKRSMSELIHAKVVKLWECKGVSAVGVGGGGGRFFKKLAQVLSRLKVMLCPNTNRF